MEWKNTRPMSNSHQCCSFKRQYVIVHCDGMLIFKLFKKLSQEAFFISLLYVVSRTTFIHNITFGFKMHPWPWLRPCLILPVHMNKPSNYNSTIDLDNFTSNCFSILNFLWQILYQAIKIITKRIIMCLWSIINKKESNIRSGEIENMFTSVYKKAKEENRTRRSQI